MVATTLGSPQRCMAFKRSSEVIARHCTPRPQDVPEQLSGPVALAGPEQLRGLFAESGFAGIKVESFETTLIEIDGAVVFWDMFEETMGPLIRMQRDMSPVRRERMRADRVDVLSAAFPDGPEQLTGEVLLAMGTAGD